MTCESRSMSRPRAATSVATSRSALPSRNRAITRSRCRCSMPPCSASALWPCAFSVSTSVSTSRRVRQNTSADAGVLGLEHALERRRLVRARDDVGHLADARQLAGRRLSRARSRRAPDPSGDAWRSTGCAAASSPRTAPSAGPPASPRGSRRDPRRSPCRASRRPRRGPASAACRAPACARRM